MKIGVLGLGSIGMRHARNLLAMGHEVIGYDPVISDDASLALGLYLTPRRDEVFHCDAVVSATPSAQHIDDLRSAVVYGAPIFMEKPLGDRMTDDLPALVRDARMVFVGYNLRFHSCVFQAKLWLTDGLIGKPVSARLICGQFNDKPAYLRDGVILNWSHEIDLAFYLFGPAEVACAHAHASNGHDDIADIVLKHASGVMSTIHLNYISRPEVRITAVTGTTGVMALDLVHRGAVAVHPEGKVQFMAGETWDDNYRDEMQAFLDRVAGNETVRGATGEDGLAVLRLCLAARQMAGLT